MKVQDCRRQVRSLRAEGLGRAAAKRRLQAYGLHGSFLRERPTLFVRTQPQRGYTLRRPAVSSAHYLAGARNAEEQALSR